MQKECIAKGLRVTVTTKVDVMWEALNMLTVAKIMRRTDTVHQ